MGANLHSSPLTVALVKEIRSTLERIDMTIETFRSYLNKNLPPTRQVGENQSGYVKLARWLNPHGARWPEPNGEIVLALQKTIREIIANNP